MPKIVIWMPHNEDHPGHVAIATNEYYVSLWPARCLIKDEKQTRRILKGIEFGMEVHKGCLVFHQDLDKEDEESDPNYEHEIDAAKVSNEDLNAEIEAFLRYNEIDPEDVTLARGDEKYREYRQLLASLPPEEAKRIKDDQKPVKSLAKTKYSIMTELVSSKKDDDSAPFYKSQQSCVSLAFNLVQMAWLKCHPARPIPIVNYEEAKNAKEISPYYIAITIVNLFFTAKIPKEFVYKVPWFEKEVVRRYLITGSKVNNQPIIPAQLEIDQALRQVKAFLVSTFILLLFGYFFPETRYPNVFIFWNFVGEDEVIDDPSILRYFIVPLFIILLAHNWCGVVLSVVIFHYCDISYDIMKSYLSASMTNKQTIIMARNVSRIVARYLDADEQTAEIGATSAHAWLHKIHDGRFSAYSILLSSHWCRWLFSATGGVVERPTANSQLDLPLRPGAFSE
ncbi:hypothetical protein DAPPUDRAFT_107682 [Daphnia pulex]|uniref:Uncharacterized protein n=1 Tax=Daphnia pulex TaxID=6669 RepID=E9GXX0_DAPPU|nr:hypothetical protein DAPPUDRAFT_107682 [Daphnia pulex]|eukprot:EFX75732.1 hypothetical protein DAPPUDRAFT_107682 [Daphnia pulex]